MSESIGLFAIIFSLACISVIMAICALIFFLEAKDSGDSNDVSLTVAFSLGGIFFILMLVASIFHAFGY